MRRAVRAGEMLLTGILAIVVLVSFAADVGAANDLAGEILQATGVQGGLVVHVGCGDGRLTAALGAGDGFLVHGLDADAENVRKARRHVRSLGIYGNKVAIDRFDGRRLPYADNLVNLLVAENLGDVPAAEVTRVLCPDGVAHVKQNGQWTTRTKPRPEEIDEWTHYLHDADNNAVAKDTVVGPPRRSQWIAGPRWGRSHDFLASVSAMVSAGGRIFYIIDEGSIAIAAAEPKWALAARDAFSGVLLWKRPIGPWEGHLRGFRSGPTELARRLVAVGDRVYVTLGYGKPVTMLDAATGETLRTFDETANALEIVHHNNTLFAVVGDRTPDNTAGAAKPVNPQKIWHWWSIYEDTPPKKHLVAIRPETGKVLWKKDDADTVEIMPTTLAAAGQRVYFQSHKELLALDASSAEVLWRADRTVNRQRPSWSAPTLVVYGNVVLCGDRAADGVAPGLEPSDKPSRWIVNSLGGAAPVGQIVAFAADTGKRLWESDCRECYNAPVDVLVAGGLVWSGNLVSAREPGITKGLDVNTGEVVRTRPADNTFFRIIMGHHRCHRNKATEKYLVLGRDGIEMIDVATGKGFGHAWVRGTCQYGVMPCNGLIYAPPHSCACHVESLLNSFNCLAPAGKAENGERKAEETPRLERGPAYEQIRNLKSEITNSSDWPTYRHDQQRTGRSSSAVPAELKPAWEAELPGGRLSSPVVAGGKVFVARIDEHTVSALDAEDGRLLWEFTAGGRVDSPPTIYSGTAIFGSADGWIYCLRADDGELAWRFRAAPQDRRIVSYGQIESAWPVHGSVLVDGGVVYAAAGRSTHLDGGMALCRLDAATGKKLSETPMTGGAKPDVLSSDGESVFMRHKRFDRQGVEQKTVVPHLYSPAGFLEGSWWHRTYWVVGTGMRSNWGGWPVVGNQVPAGRLLVLDESTVYGFGRFNQYHRDGSHVGLGRTRYLLYGTARPPQRGAKPPAKVASLWQRPLPVLARGMVLADETLFVAGPPDTFVDAPQHVTDRYHVTSVEALRRQEAALAGKLGGVLLAVSTVDGKQLAQTKLAAVPEWDAMAAAAGRLYLATTDGKVLCFSGR